MWLRIRRILNVYNRSVVTVSSTFVAPSFKKSLMLPINFSNKIHFDMLKIEMKRYKN